MKQSRKNVTRSPSGGPVGEDMQRLTKWFEALCHTLRYTALKFCFQIQHARLYSTVICRDAGLAGLSTSLFDRLTNLGVKPHLLDVQFRMHPAGGLFFVFQWQHTSSDKWTSVSPKPQSFIWGPSFDYRGVRCPLFWDQVLNIGGPGAYYWRGRCPSWGIQVHIKGRSGAHHSGSQLPTLRAGTRPTCSDEPPPRVCMSIRPEGKSRGHVRYRFECLFSRSLLSGDFAIPVGRVLRRARAVGHAGARARGARRVRVAAAGRPGGLRARDGAQRAGEPRGMAVQVDSIKISFQT